MTLSWTLWKGKHLFILRFIILFEMKRLTFLQIIILNRYYNKTYFFVFDSTAKFYKGMNICHEFIGSNSLPASFVCYKLPFANSLDSDQA